MTVSQTSKIKRQRRMMATFLLATLTRPSSRCCVAAFTFSRRYAQKSITAVSQSSQYISHHQIPINTYQTRLFSTTEESTSTDEISTVEAQIATKEAAALIESIDAPTETFPQHACGRNTVAFYTSCNTMRPSSKQNVRELRAAICK